MIYLLCILGVVLIIKGADFLVGGASALAKHLCVSDMALGLIVVSFGTSLPESLISGLNGVYVMNRGGTRVYQAPLPCSGGAGYQGRFLRKS
jgi:Ca2+/Na+ antiporter